jgi:hypothetical protein
MEVENRITLTTDVVEGFSCDTSAIREMKKER